MLRLFLFISAVAAMIVCCGRESRAQESQNPPEALNTHHAAKVIAEKIASQLGPNPPKEILVRAFNAPNGEYDAGFAKMVADELAALKFTIDNNAGCEVTGRIGRFPPNPGLPLEGMMFFGDVIHENAPINNARFEVKILNLSDAAQRVIPTGEVALPPLPNLPKDRQAEAKPTVEQFKMAPHPQSPYSATVERLVNEKWAPVEAILIKGDFQITLSKGDRFRIVCHNSSPFDAWARTTLDGVNRFAFANDPRFRNAVDIVHPNSATHQSCFFRNLEGGDGFQIGEAFANAKMKAPSNAIGTIVVSFGAAWEKGKTVPPGEPDPTRKVTPAGVDLGPQVKATTQEVSREIGQVRATVRIRYEVK